MPSGAEEAAAAARKAKGLPPTQTPEQFYGGIIAKLIARRIGMLTGYKTVIVAALIAVFGALQGLNWVDLVSNPQIAGWVVTAIGVVMFVLRSLTTTPIGVKK